MHATFDPTATTPTPGTISESFGGGTGGGGPDANAHGAFLAMGADNDYIVFGRMDFSDSNK